MKFTTGFRSLLCLVLFTSTSLAQVQMASPPYDDSQFINIGTITSLTVDDNNDLFSGGTITINEIPAIVPRNLIAILPNIEVAWSELFKGGVPQLPLLGSVTWEAAVYGNKVNGTNIVGMVFIVQDSSMLLTDFISQINPDGTFRIGGDSSVPDSGRLAVLNDPVGRFGVPYVDNPLWAADTDFPSITAVTGFPMCFPRNAQEDPLCPSKNRPGNPPVMTIQFIAEALRQDTDPDPNFMVPLVVGDYITYSGTEVGNGLMAIYMLQANVGLFTVPNEAPSYLRISTNQFAVDGPLDAETGMDRAVVFTSDPFSDVQWYAIDEDPCTGAQTQRNLFSSSPLAAIVGQAAGTVVFRGGKDDFSPPTRYTGFLSATGTKLVSNGTIMSGLAIGPILGFANGIIFPELTTYGDPMFALEFDSIPYLAQGSGPFVETNPVTPLMLNPPIVGQLDPWPGSSVPGPAICIGQGATTTTSSAPTATPTHDTLILTGYVDSGREFGQDMYTISANSTQNVPPLPVLTISATGLNPFGPAQMINFGGGAYGITFQVKTPITSYTINSTLGGSIFIDNPA